jgi:hypothetical protein
MLASSAEVAALVVAAAALVVAADVVAALDDVAADVVLAGAAVVVLAAAGVAAGVDALLLQPNGAITTRASNTRKMTDRFRVVCILTKLLKLFWKYLKC